MIFKDIHKHLQDLNFKIISFDETTSMMPDVGIISSLCDFNKEFLYIG